MAPPAAQKVVGVPTTTPLAFLSAGVLYLERMNILAADGCGVLCEALPLVGEEIPLVFKLSTHKEALRCKGRVEGTIPTTPSGLQLAQTLGEKGLHAATSSSMGDSATMMFRLSELKEMGKAASAPTPSRPVKAVGFCVRFLDLSTAAQAAVTRHINVSRKLGDQFATRGGGMVSLNEDDRNTLATMFSDGELSNRAKDW